MNEEQTKQIDFIRASAHHLLSLINDVLDISKIEAGQLEVEVAPVDIRASFQRVLESVKPLADRKGLALELDLPQDVSFVLGDARRVDQVLLNLVNNAIKFTEKGKITLSACRYNKMINISISDTGIGIRTEDLQGLFQPFRQLETGLARKYEGTGLGLAICKKLVELMGGTIKVTSRWGQGSVFTFSVPAAEGG